MAGRAKQTRKRHDETELRDPAWERQRWETAGGYDRFRLYRDLGATRSIARVARGAGVSDDAMGDMSAANLWVERARRYDAYLDALGRSATEDAVREQATENARRVAAMQQEEWEIWQLAKDGITSLIGQAIAGEPKAGGAAAQLLREANRVARMATGQPTEGSRPKADEQGREADIDAFLDNLAGGAPADSAREIVRK